MGTGGATGSGKGREWYSNTGRPARLACGERSGRHGREPFSCSTDALLAGNRAAQRTGSARSPGRTIVDQDSDAGMDSIACPLSSIGGVCFCCFVTLPTESGMEKARAVVAPPIWVVTSTDR